MPLLAGGLHLRDTRAEYDQVKAQLTQLKRENAQLSHTYHTRYDLADIQTQAEAQGMIPEEEADSFTVFFSIPEPPKEKQSGTISSGFCPGCSRIPRIM